MWELIFFHDDVHNISDAENDDADALEDAEKSSSDEEVPSENEPAVAADDITVVVEVDIRIRVSLAEAPEGREKNQKVLHAHDAITVKVARNLIFV